MKLSRLAWILGAVALALGAANVVAWRPAADARANLPRLGVLAAAEAQRIEISTPVEKLLIARDPGRDGAWMIQRPIQYRADDKLVNQVIEGVSGVVMDAMVDEGDTEVLETYSVDHQAGLLFEAWSTGDVPAVSVVVGKNAGAGRVFVRLPSNPEGPNRVYRAQLGGRTRFERAAADWRDKMALSFDRKDARALRLVRGAETLEFSRPAGGEWSLRGSLPIDTETVDAMVQALANLRATDIHVASFDGGFSAPAAVAELTLEGGAAHRVEVGERADARAAFVKVDAQPAVFRVPARVRDLLAQPLSALRDRTMLDIPADEVQSITLSEGGITIAVGRTEDGASWQITQPANMDADPGEVNAVLARVAGLRATGLAPDPSFTPVDLRLVLQRRDGSSAEVRFGELETPPEGRPVRRARVTGRPEVFLVQEDVLVLVRRALGRG
jgi:hypothetical protein